MRHYIQSRDVAGLLVTKLELVEIFIYLTLPLSRVFIITFDMQAATDDR